MPFFQKAGLVAAPADAGESESAESSEARRGATSMTTIATTCLVEEQSCRLGLRSWSQAPIMRLQRIRSLHLRPQHLPWIQQRAACTMVLHLSSSRPLQGLLLVATQRLRRRQPTSQHWQACQLIGNAGEWARSATSSTTSGGTPWGLIAVCPGMASCVARTRSAGGVHWAT